MDTEPTLTLKNVNIFITVTAKARDEPLTKGSEKAGEILKRLGEFLVENNPDVISLAYYPMDKPRVNNKLIEEYAKSIGVQITHENLEYISDYIFGLAMTKELYKGDNKWLSVFYLEEVPFIRLGLRGFTLKLGESFPVEKLRNTELRCHLTAIIHRLGVVALTCWIEVPVPLTVDEINALIDVLDEQQIIIEQQGLRREATTLVDYLRAIRLSLLAPLVSYLHGQEPAKEMMQVEKIERYLDILLWSKVVLHIGDVMIEGERVADIDELVKKCPRQLAALVTHFTPTWKYYTLDEAEEKLRKHLVAKFRDELLFASFRGVVIYLGNIEKPSYLDKVDQKLRDFIHEEHQHSVLSSSTLDVVRCYQIVAIVQTTIKSYDQRIRKINLESIKSIEIESLLDIVERGLEEIDNYYTLVTAEPDETVLRKALEAADIFRLKELIEKRLTHLDRVLKERQSRTLDLLTIVISLLGIYSVIGVLLDAISMGLGLLWVSILLIPALLMMALILGLSELRKSLKYIFE